MPNPASWAWRKLLPLRIPTNCSSIPKADYFDPKSPKDNPRWLTIDVKALAKCPVIPIKTLRNDPALANLRILQRGNRLSITPVERDDFAHILKTLFH